MRFHVSGCLAVVPDHSTEVPAMSCKWGAALDARDLCGILGLVSGYQVLARRCRPVEFSDVVGQEQVLTTLCGCLEQSRLPHAFLFCGSRGVGKTTTARILARAVNCETQPGPTPCGTCDACRSILEGSASDVIELDAASNNGVDEVRALREQAGYAPIKLRRKVFVLDEVHMFSRSAFNALLKILEEPPEHVLFILATTEAHKVPETVRSRCQVLPFRRIREADIVARLGKICEGEGVTAAPEVLNEIAVASMGGLRDAETALERILPLAQELDLDKYRELVGRLGLTRAAELVGACLDGDAAAALAYAGEAVETGVDERECLGEVLDVLRLVFLLVVDGVDSVLVEADGGWRETLQSLAERADLAQIDAMMQIVVLARERIRVMDDRRVLLELTLVRLARVAELTSLGELSRAAPAATPARKPAVQSSVATASKPAPSPKSELPPTPRPDVSGTQDSEPWAATVALVLAERPQLGEVLERARLEWDGRDRLCLSWDSLKGIEKTLVTSRASTTFLAERLAANAGRKIEIAIDVETAEPASKQRKASARSSRAKSGKPSAQASATGRKSQPAVDDKDLPPIAKTVVDLFGVHQIEREEPDQS